jgi:hypothetical protein
MVGTGLARQPAGWSSAVAGTLGVSVSELGAMRLAGPQQGQGVLEWSEGVSGAERRPSRSRAPVGPVNRDLY